MEGCGEALSSGADMTISHYGADVVGVAYRVTWLHSPENRKQNGAAIARSVVLTTGLLMPPLGFGYEIPYIGSHV